MATWVDGMTSAAIPEAARNGMRATAALTVTQMRIILDGSVSTVKRLRISMGTLVAIEATVTPTDHASRAAIDATASAGHAAKPEATALASRGQFPPASRTTSAAHVAPDSTT